jgi:E-phenylitaconyl-CoA hydratase
MPVDLHVAERIATITFNRPEAMNAYDREMREQAYEVWRRIDTDDAIDVAVVTGAGDKAFCTGSDLKNSMPPADSHARMLLMGGDPGVLLHGFHPRKPMVCAINGFALGGGLELALACDIRIASDNARMGLTEAKVGSIPGSGGAQRLARAIGRSDAMLMLLTGTLIDSATALRIGLVSRVVPQAELMDNAIEIARQIASNGPLAVRAIKRLVDQGLDMPLPQALEMDRYFMGLLRDSEDRIEGRRAFAEKRKPVFKGR